MPSEQGSTSLAILKRVPFSPACLATRRSLCVTSHILPRKFAVGEMIFSEGDPCARTITLCNRAMSASSKVPRAGASKYFQSTARAVRLPSSPFLIGGGYPASAQAVSDSTLLFFSRQDFQALCLQHPEVALKVLRVIGGPLRRLVGSLKNSRLPPFATGSLHLGSLRQGGSDSQWRCGHAHAARKQQ